MVAGAILSCTLVLAITKTILLVDALYQLGGGSGVVARVSQCIRLAPSARQPPSTRSVRSSFSSVRRRSSANAATAVAGYDTRSLHRRLISMHLTSSMTQGAGAALFLLPVSDTSCVVSIRILVVNDILYQASLALFLLAKVHITYDRRGLACWEKCFIWWSRLYAVILLPSLALRGATSIVAFANPEGKFCFVPSSSTRAGVLGLNYALLITQLILLLGLFVKPMLARMGENQSGSDLYRRVVVRNVICTAGIVTSYAIASVVVIMSQLRESPTNDKAGQVRYATVGINSLGTLCLTEITLPLGFSSCFATCRKAARERNVTKNPAGRRTTENGGTFTATTNNTKVVPVQELLPPRLP